MTDRLRAAEITCRRCAQRVLVAQSTTLRRVVYLDPTPSVAGVYRITRDGDAEFVTPSEVRPGELLFPRHLCPSGPPDPAAPVCAYCGETAAGHDPGVGPSWLTCRDGTGRQCHLDVHFARKPDAVCGRCGAGVVVTDDDGEPG